MQPANDPNVNYKELVQRSYDQCAQAYAAARRGENSPELNLLTIRLPAGARVLDIGCGAGVPIAQILAKRFQVTGVDISAEQIRRARQNVPHGAFIQSDIMAVDFPPAHFDAVVAFYSIFHLPREEHAELFRRIHYWLRPGGYFLATLTAYNEPAYTEDDFFGVTMYWSNYGFDEYKVMLSQIGFRLLETTTIGHGYGENERIPVEQHPLLFAQAG